MDEMSISFRSKNNKFNKEHFFDKLTRLGKRYVIVRSDYLAIIHYFLLDGTANDISKVSLPVSWFNTCELCGRYGTPKKVTYRSDVWNWDILKRKEVSKSNCMFCMSCWNKVKALDNKKHTYLENEKLIVKINNTITQRKKL